MRKRYILLLVLLAFVAQVAEADTIHLKNGSILKGKVASFADEQFVVMLDTGSGRYLSRAMVYIGDVARIEFDGAPAASAEPVQRSNEAPARVVLAPDIPRARYINRVVANHSARRNSARRRARRIRPTYSLRLSKNLSKKKRESLNRSRKNR